MSIRYLVLSGELPGEGVWCTARTYKQLVARVREVWGEDFCPVFKYKLQCSPTGGDEEVRYYKETSTFGFNRPSASNEEEKKKATASSRDSFHVEAGMTGLCFVVLDDEDDFFLWYNGGSLEEKADHHYDDEVFHHTDYHTEDNPRPAPLTMKLFAFRKTTNINIPGSGQEDLIVNMAATHGMSKEDSAHYYAHSMRKRDGLVRSRSSPAVKHSDSDVVRVPMHALLQPLLLLKLGVTAVLRHSNASEVILYSDKYSITGGGCGEWGQLVLKARSAWGVHSPVLRYLDLSQGYMQMNIAAVPDFAFWAETVGRDRRELLVLEQAPEQHHVSDPALRENIAQYYAAQPPVAVDAHSGVNLKTLVEKLKELERVDRESAVQRPVPLPTKCVEERLLEERVARELLYRHSHPQEEITEETEPYPYIDLNDLPPKTVKPAQCTPEKHLTAVEKYERLENLLKSMMRGDIPGPDVPEWITRECVEWENAEDKKVGFSDDGAARHGDATANGNGASSNNIVHGRRANDGRGVYTEEVSGDWAAQDTSSINATSIIKGDGYTDDTIMSDQHPIATQTPRVHVTTSSTNTSDVLLRNVYNSVVDAKYPSHTQQSAFVRRGVESGRYGAQYTVKGTEEADDGDDAQQKYLSRQQKLAAEHHKALTGVFRRRINNKKPAPAAADISLE